MAGAADRLKVFISYSRRDSSEFADELLAGLELAGFDAFLDRHDIAAGEAWESRLGGLIQQSDTVAFVISPAAVKSERCVWEVDKTLALSKRVLPVTHKPVPDTDIPKQLASLQFVRFDQGRGFARPLAELAEALRQDLDWIREHTRLGEEAALWHAQGKPEWLLRRAGGLAGAKAWVAERKPDAPEITEQQRQFLAASEDAEAARNSNERQQLEAIRTAQEATARSQRRGWHMLGGFSTLLFATITYIGWQALDLAERETRVFASLAASALKEEQYDRAMRYALQAYPARGSLPWAVFSTELEGKLAGGAQLSRLKHLLKGHTATITAAELSPDGRWIVTASEDNTARVWDLQSGTELTILKGHTAAIQSAKFSADSARLVTRILRPFGADLGC